MSWKPSASALGTRYRSWFQQAGLAKAYLGEFAQALPWNKKSIDANRNQFLGLFLLAACLAHLGRLDEARKEVKAGLAVNPKFTIARCRAGVQSDNAVFSRSARTHDRRHAHGRGPEG